jgi:hypothetical protein
MEIFKAKIVARQKTKWMLGYLNDYVFVEEQKIKKLSDLDNYKDYVNINTFFKKKGYNEEYLKKVFEKNGFDSVYVLPMTTELSSKTHNEYFWKKINKKCLTCTKDCKQSSKIQIIRCPFYERKKV